MRIIMIGITVLSLLFSLSVVTYAIHEIIPSETQAVEPGPNAEKLSDYIIKYNPYRAWNLWPNKGRLYKGSEPHGALLTTFVNDAAYHSIKSKKGMSERSLIVKENYTAEKKFVSLTVMYKINGYNPSAGDWFWAKYAPDGKVLVSGKAEACINCHAKRKNNEYIMTGEVKGN